MKRTGKRLLALLFAAALCFAEVPPALAAQSTSSTAKTSVALSFKSQPKDVEALVGETVKMTVSATGSGLTYCWQYSDDFGETWKNSSIKKATYSTTAAASRHGRLLRCVITDKSGNKITSKPAAILVDTPLAIATHPQDVFCSVGDTVRLSAKGESAALRYMWQYSIDGLRWIDLGAKKSTYTVTATAETFRRLYRCKMSDNYGNSCSTDVAQIFDENALILEQPKNWIGAASGKAFFEATVSDRVVSCRWQISANNGESWNNSSVTTPYYAVTATEEKANWLYRCVATDKDGRQQISDAVSLTITDEFYIAAQPQDVFGKLGETVTFSIQAGGTNLSFQWQRSTDGKTWSTVAQGQARLNQAVTPSTVGRYYRCLVENEDGRTLYSRIVQLTRLGTGFFTYNGKRYYIKDDGQLAIGFETIDGNLYYFKEAGGMLHGLQKLDGGIYYFTARGCAAKGFVYVASEYGTFYFGEDHTAAIGWTEIGEDRYYFYKTGVMARGVTQIGKGEYFFDHETGAQKYGMIEVGLGKYMYFQRGKDRPFAGLKTVNGALYYFSKNANEYGVTVDSMQTVDGDKYYFDPETQKAVSGFITYNGNRYYMGKDYRMVKDSLIKVSGKTYLLHANGMVRYGLITYKGNRYYFNPDTGAAVSGWMDLDGTRMYFDKSTYAAKTGTVTIGGVKYRFTSSGYLNPGVADVGGTRYFTDANGKTKTGFVEVNNNIYYVHSDRKVATGLTTIGGKRYYFDSYGVMRTGFRTINSKRYYFDPDTGAAATGLVQLGNGNTYAFNSSKGTYSGLVKLGGALYYADSSGIVRYGRVVVSGDIYYFDPNTGKAVTGWQSIRSSDGKVRKAYFDPKTYRAVTGLRKIGGKTYYFSDQGWAQTGKRVVNGKTYYFAEGTYESYNKAKAPSRSCVWGTVGGSKCFYGPNGKKLTGLQTIDGKLYYFGTDGKLRTGRIKVDGTYYYFTTSGARFGKVTISKKEYYFSPSNGEMLTGLQKIDGKLYYYQENGTKKSGWISLSSGDRLYMTSKGLQTGLAVIGGKTYFFGEDGVMRTGVQSVTKDGKQITCQFDKNGVLMTGLVTSNGNKYYYDKKTGARQTGFVTVGTAEYYFDPLTGKAATGLRNINGIYCCFDTKTAKRKYGLQTVNGRVYHFKKTGTGFTSGLITSSGKTYLFSEINGIAASGVREIDGVKYYFDPKTGASVSGLFSRNDGRTYYFKAGGGVKTGWVTVDGKRYFFYPTTGLMAEGLASVGDKLYYFDAEKGLLRNTTVKSGGISYRLDKNGYAKATGSSNVVKIINAGIANLDKGYGDEGAKENANTVTCSQFVSNMLQAVDVDIIKGVYKQYYAVVNGKYDTQLIEDISKAKAGDLVYFSIIHCKYGSSCDYWNEIHHVGIYLGDGKIMDSNLMEGDSYNEGPMVRDLVDSSNVLVYKFVRIKDVNG